MSKTKDKRYQLKMSLKLPLNANLFLAALPSAPSQSLEDKEISNQNKLQHIPRAIQSLIRSILRPILSIISECPTPLPCKLCHGYSNWKCLIKANYENCNLFNVISKQSAHGGRANSLNRRAESWFWEGNGLINCWRSQVWQKGNFNKEIQRPIYTNLTEIWNIFNVYFKLEIAEHSG